MIEKHKERNMWFIPMADPGRTKGLNSAQQIAAVQITWLSKPFRDETHILGTSSLTNCSKKYRIDFSILALLPGSMKRGHQRSTNNGPSCHIPIKHQTELQQDCSKQIKFHVKSSIVTSLYFVSEWRGASKRYRERLCHGPSSIKQISQTFTQQISIHQMASQCVSFYIHSLMVISANYRYFYLPSMHCLHDASNCNWWSVVTPLHHI